MVSPRYWDCVNGMILSRLFFIIASCQKALIKEILHHERTHECSCKIGALFGRTLTFIGIFGPFLRRHLCFGPMIFMRTATHPQQEHEEREATVHGVRG